MGFDGKGQCFGRTWLSTNMLDDDALAWLANPPMAPAPKTYVLDEPMQLAGKAWQEDR